MSNSLEGGETIDKSLDKYFGIVKSEKHLSVEEIEEKAKELTKEYILAELCKAPKES